MTIFKEWFVILNLVGLFSGTLFASEPFTYSLTPSTIQPGNHAVLRLSVPIEPQENEGSITVNDALLFESPELIVLEKTSERTDCCLTISYDLTGYKSKSYLLPPIEIKTHGNSFSTETKTLAIASLRPEEDNEIRESFGALTPPFPFRKWGKIVGLLLILTFLLVTLPKKLKLLYRKRPLYQTKKVPTIPTEDPLLWLKKQIHQLKLKHKQDPFNERRQPADLELAADGDVQVGSADREDEAGLRLHEMRILVTLRERGHRHLIAANLAGDRPEVFGGRDDVQLALRVCRRRGNDGRSGQRDDESSDSHK